MNKVFIPLRQLSLIMFLTRITLSPQFTKPFQNRTYPQIPQFHTARLTRDTVSFGASGSHAAGAGGDPPRKRARKNAPDDIVKPGTLQKRRSRIRGDKDAPPPKRARKKALLQLLKNYELQKSKY